MSITINELKKLKRKSLAATSFRSITPYTIPEPTSYSGRFHLDLDVPADAFAAPESEGGIALPMPNAMGANCFRARDGMLQVRRPSFVDNLAVSGWFHIDNCVPTVEQFGVLLSICSVSEPVSKRTPAYRVQLLSDLNAAAGLAGADNDTRKRIEMHVLRKYVMAPDRWHRLLLNISKRDNQYRLEFFFSDQPGLPPEYPASPHIRVVIPVDLKAGAGSTNAFVPDLLSFGGDIHRFEEESEVFTARGDRVVSWADVRMYRDRVPPHDDDHTGLLHRWEPPFSPTASAQATLLGRPITYLTVVDRCSTGTDLGHEPTWGADQRLLPGTARMLFLAGYTGLRARLSGTCPLKALPNRSEAWVSERYDTTAIAEAFQAGKSTGQFPRDLFPYIASAENETRRTQLVAALASISKEEVKRQYQAGCELSVRTTGMAGLYEVSFIPVSAAQRKPRLLLVLCARLTTYPNRLGAGRVVHTVSLFPGEETSISITTYRRTLVESTRSSSILDSYTTSAAQDFERRLENEQTTQADRSFTQSYSARAEAEANWGWGSAEAEVTARWDINTNVRQFSRNVGSALAKHSAAASTQRNIEVNSTEHRLEENSRTEAIVRTIKNINVSRTLNFVFYQLNQELLSLLHLTDVKLAYFDGTPGSVREVPLEQAERLLSERVVKGRRDEIHSKIREQLKQLVDYEGIPSVGADKFFLDVAPTTGAGAPEGSALKALRVNPGFLSQHPVGDGVSDGVSDGASDGGDDKAATVEVQGMILSAESLIMRTDNVFVDSFLGQIDALDPYSKRLQELDLDARRLENEALASKTDALKLGMQLSSEGKHEAAAAIADLLGRKAAGGKKQRDLDEANDRNDKR